MPVRGPGRPPPEAAMSGRQPIVLILAAGTGGHIFPALCIARELQRAGVGIHWLGTSAGMENKLLRDEDFPFYAIGATGLRGAGLPRLLKAPFMLLRSTWRAMWILRELRPDCLLGMGGFVTGPAALAGRLLRIPVLIHEQNAVPGLTNQIVSRWAERIYEAFPKTFPRDGRVLFTGNPVRREILGVADRRRRRKRGPLRLLVLGGSQGADALNALIPDLIAGWRGDQPLKVLHQCGFTAMAKTRQRYQDLAVKLDSHHRLVGFIREMGDAYAWADLVLCRSGAGTVAEIAVCGLPAIFVPYPHHKDQQQLFNARWLAARQAAEIIEQSELSLDRLEQILLRLEGDRDWLAEMSRRAHDMAVTDAAKRAADSCLAFLREREEEERSEEEKHKEGEEAGAGAGAGADHDHD